MSANETTMGTLVSHKNFKFPVETKFSQRNILIKSLKFPIGNLSLKVNVTLLGDIGFFLFVLRNCC